MIAKLLINVSSLFASQALANVSTLDSQQSDPVSVTWPGVEAPILQRHPAGKVNIIRIKWDEPLLTGGAKVKYIKVGLTVFYIAWFIKLDLMVLFVIHFPWT